MPQFFATIDLSSLNGATGFRLEGVSADDRAGTSVSSAGDINGDGFDDLIIGARPADANGTDSGASYVVFGKSTGFLASINLSSLDGASGFRIDGEFVGDQFGYAVSSAGDINNDGFDDLLIGAIDRDAVAFKAGAAYVMFGKAAGFSASINANSLIGPSGFEINGSLPYSSAGWSTAAAGDVNGDGFDDFVVGSPFDVGTTGAVDVVFGRNANTNPFPDASQFANLNGTDGFSFSGKGSGDMLGISVSGAGDVNGDGFDDLIVGAYRADGEARQDSGESYVVFGKAGPFSATINLNSLDGTNGFAIISEAALDLSGAAVSSAGDVNGDGYDDLLVGSLHNDQNGSNAGAAYVIFGKPTGFSSKVFLDGDLDGNTGFKIDGAAALNGTGHTVASAGDFNGDGFADVLIGAYGADINGLQSGSAYVVFGKAGGFDPYINVSDLNGDNGFRLDGAAANDFSATAIASAGDINNDGFDDLIIGARSADVNGVDSGASYVVFGHRPGAALQFVGSIKGQKTHGSDFADVFNGNGGADIFNGYGGDDSFVTDGGDVIVETADGGTDTVFSSADHTLAANVENLTLITTAISATGNLAANMLAGNVLANILDGAGGADTIAGDAGDDTYFTDGGDTIVETTGGGIDTVESLIDYVLGEFVENLVLRGTAVSGTGNAEANILTGNALDNTLIGLGGDDRLHGGGGLDLLEGGAGNDTYVIDGGETIVESVGGGTDSVESSVDYELVAEIENLVLTGVAVAGTGNASANHLTGNASDNTLFGMEGDDIIDGSSGNDTMTGGTGDDIYKVDFSIRLHS